MSKQYLSSVGYAPIMTDAERLTRSRGYKLNVFQLAKRVRRATRHGKGFLRVLNFTNGKVDRDSRNRNHLAGVGLRHCERTLRLARYYCAAFNIPTSENAFSL